MRLLKRIPIILALLFHLRGALITSGRERGSAYSKASRELMYSCVCVCMRMIEDRTRHAHARERETFD